MYLDHAATTPIADVVLEAMLPILKQHYGNPSSAHQMGNTAKVRLEKSRDQVAALVHAKPSEIIFTGSGTEATNMALIGACFKANPGQNLVVSAIEHPATMQTARMIAEQRQLELRIAPIREKDGQVDTAPFIEAIDEQTALVSLMLVNNETGTILPVREIFQHAQSHRALLHCDAVQALGKVPVDVTALHCHAMSLSAHKIYGPKGIGALFLKRGTRLPSMIYGGPQESGRRAGTESVANAVGFGAAARLAQQTDVSEIAKLRDHFEAELKKTMPDSVHINGGNLPRAAHISNVQFQGQDGNLMLIQLDQHGICVSTGSACSSGSLSPSPALMALGLSEGEAAASLRFSFGKDNTLAEVNRAVTLLKTLITS
jgi:cysteine desulfurase